MAAMSQVSEISPEGPARIDALESGAPPAAALQRFVRAQQRDYVRALAELQAGRKTTHWIWYVLPQLRGLGRSAMAREYGLEGRDEAAAYVSHSLLGPRLVACVQAMLQHRGHSAAQILGEVDAIKFRSCLTLFAAVAPGEPCFGQALQVFYGGEPDPATLQLLRQAVDGSAGLPQNAVPPAAPCSPTSSSAPTTSSAPSASTGR